jgi:ribosomal protein S18 acetylase RimI-like enzyme
MKPDAIDEPGMLETDLIPVRTLQESDLNAVVAIDTASSGRRRPRYFELMLERAVKHSALQVSLVAELDGRVAGFLLATLYYGEFGVVEPTCSLEAIGVDPRYRRRHVGHALMRQLRLNLGALRIATLRTEAAWDDFELLAFFRREGFVPAGRLCLESHLNPTAPSD